jgi:hypothetical protein
MAGGTGVPTPSAVTNGAATPMIDTSGWTQGPNGSWLDASGKVLPGGINPTTVSAMVPPTITPAPTGPQGSPPAPGYVGTGREGGGAGMDAITQPISPRPDPWAKPDLPVNPWGTPTNTLPATSAPPANQTSRGTSQGQALTDFLKGFYSAFQWPGSTTTPTTPTTPATPVTTDPRTAKKQPMAPIVTPLPSGGGTSGGDGTGDSGGTGGSGGAGGSGGTRNQMNVNAYDTQPTITPVGAGGSGAPPAGAVRVPVPSGMPQDLWQLPDGTRVRFPGYTG